jgi:hypothetical protein
LNEWLAIAILLDELILTGEKASGNFLIEQANPVASDVRGGGSGHWLLEEAPKQ